MVIASTTVRFAALHTAFFAVFLQSFISSSFAQQCPDGGPEFPRIALVYGSSINPSTTEASLRSLARYDLLIGYGYGHRWGASAQRSIAEKFQTLRSLKGAPINILNFELSGPYLSESSEREGFPSEGYLRNLSGERIPGWPGSFMLNLAEPRLLSHLSGYAQQTLAAGFGLDGVFFDSMAPQFDLWACNIVSGLPCASDFDRNGLADDLSTLNERWRLGKYELLRATRNSIGNSALFMANQAEPAAAEFLNGILLEDHLNYVLDSGKSWQKTFDDYRFWSSRSKQPTITTLVSSSGIDVPINIMARPLTEQNEYLEAGRRREQRMRFGLATALQADGYFAYDLSTNWRGQEWWYREYDTALGCASGPSVTTESGLWQRVFDGGIAIVNPTNYDHSVTLPVGTRPRTEQRQVCPNTLTKAYKKTCPMKARAALLKSCETKFRATKLAAKRKNLRWSGARKKKAQDKRNTCLADVQVSIGRTCFCHQESQTTTGPYLWQDTSSEQIGETFTIPALDGRVFVKVDRSAAPPNKLVITHPLPPSAPTVPELLVRDDSVRLRSASNLDLRVSLEGKISHLLVDGEQIISAIDSVFVRNRDWKPFGLFSGSMVRNGLTATFSSTTKSVDGAEIYQSLTTTADTNLIRLDYQFQSNQNISLFTNRLQLCLDMAKLRGTTMVANGRNSQIPLALNATSLASMVQTAKLGKLEFEFTPPAMIADGRAWGENCVAIFLTNPTEIAAGVPWSNQVVVHKVQ